MAAPERRHGHELELHHEPGAQRRLALPKIREPDAARPAAIRQRCSEIVRARGRTVAASILVGETIVSAGRSDPSAPSPVRHIRMAIDALHPEREVLSWHPLEIERSIPHVRRVGGIRRKVRRSRNGIRPVDRREQSQITAWIIHPPATIRYGVLILCKPHTVVSHPAGERLLRTVGSVAMA